MWVRKEKDEELTSEMTWPSLFFFFSLSFFANGQVTQPFG